MKKYLFGVLFWVLPASIALADCSLSDFRWACEEPVHSKLSHHTPSIIDCGGSNVYVTQEQYEVFERYQRASINFTLKVDGEYVRGPCVPAGYSGFIR